MTDKEAYKTIADRAAELARDKTVMELVRHKFGKNLKAAKRYVYKLAIATLYGNHLDLLKTTMEGTK